MATEEEIRVLEKDLLKEYLIFVRSLKSDRIYEQTIEMVLAGDVEGALDAIEEEFKKHAAVVPEKVRQAAVSEGNALSTLLGAAFVLDITASPLVRLMRENRHAFTRRVMEAQRIATRRAYANAAASRGSVIEAFDESLGLSEKLHVAVEKYRDTLIRQNASPDAPFLSQHQIQRMVEAYRQKLIRVRGEQVAGATAVRIISEAQQEALDQAINEGVADANNVIRVWNRIADDRVRDAHDVMQGQTSPVGGKFTDGNGSELRYPGDPLAPIGTTINCRCTLTFKLKQV